MEDKRVKKIYSYCHIGPQNEISGTVEGIVLPMKTEVISLEGEVLAIDEDEPQKCLPNATTCN